jgi:hypothetical protein
MVYRAADRWRCFLWEALTPPQRFSAPLLPLQTNADALDRTTQTPTKILSSKTRLLRGTKMRMRMSLLPQTNALPRRTPS